MHAVYYKTRNIFSEITKSQLYGHQRKQRTWKMTIAFTILRKVAAVFRADMSYYAYLNFMTQTVPTRFYRVLAILYPYESSVTFHFIAGFFRLTH